MTIERRLEAFMEERLGRPCVFMPSGRVAVYVALRASGYYPRQLRAAARAPDNRTELLNQFVLRIRCALGTGWYVGAPNPMRLISEATGLLDNQAIHLGLEAGGLPRVIGD